jgi:hypothetical protein
VKRDFRTIAAAIALSLGANLANAQQAQDPRVADLVLAGKLRGAMFMPQYTTDPSPVS